MWLQEHNPCRISTVARNLSITAVLKCKNADGVIFLQSVDTVPTAGSPALHQTVMGHSLCLLPFSNKALRRQTPATFGDRKTADLRGNSQHLFLNEAQWLKLASLITWESDTSTLLEILLRAVADESGPGITQLPHSHLQIRGWQGSSASFNYEWQPFISCLLIRWVDAAALATFSLLFWYLSHTGVETHKLRGEKGQEE